jgi:hypothetical protein
MFGRSLVSLTGRLLLSLLVKSSSFARDAVVANARLATVTLPPFPAVLMADRNGRRMEVREAIVALTTRFGLLLSSQCCLEL